MNFLKHVMQQLDVHSLGLLGAVLGENECKVRDGVKSAVPKILGAMVSASKADQGLDMLWRELRDTDVTVASDFSKQMYYKDSQALVANGHDQLDGLIGAETSRLIRSVSRESDIGSTSAKRLVGAVTPLVFATVANHQQSKQLNQSELGAVIGQQEKHLSDWERHSDQFLHGVSKNEDENEPLFKALPPGSGSAMTATAVGSATLGMHHFSSCDKVQDQQDDTDQQDESGPKDSDPNNHGRAAAYGGQSRSRLQKANEKNLADAPGGVEISGPTKDFDQRSHDRRHRKPIAVNPANPGFSANAPSPNQSTLDQPSKSVVAGSIAAAGAGVASVTAAALNPSADTPDEKDSSSSSPVKANTTNTYDSENAVSGFAAASNPSSSVTPDTSGLTKPDGGGAGTDGNTKRLWTPDSAEGQRDADGTLRYPHRDAEVANTSSTSATDSKSEGWFHWLWWPVLILGSLLALCLMFLNPDGDSSDTNAQEVNPAVVTAHDSESDYSEATDATTLLADSEKSGDSEKTSEESESDSLSPNIEITPSEPGATGSDATTKTDSPSNELTMDLAPADPSSEDENDSTSQTQNSGDNSPETNASNADKDDALSLEGSSETATAGSTESEDGKDDESKEDNDTTGNVDTDSSELNTKVLELDADEQVEELLSAIESELDGVSNEAQAKIAQTSLSQHISTLEKLLADRAQWKDEIEVLVDFQLEEGKKMLAQAKKKAFQSEAVKKTLTGKFKELNALMQTDSESP